MWRMGGMREQRSRGRSGFGRGQGDKDAWKGGRRSRRLRGRRTSTGGRSTTIRERVTSNVANGAGAEEVEKEAGRDRVYTAGLARLAGREDEHTSSEAPDEHGREEYSEPGEGNVHRSE